MDNKFMPIAVKIAELVQEKNAAYGDAAGKSVEYLKLLYPNGVRPEQYQNMLLLVRDFDKNMRIATDEDALGESPWGDKVGYGILALELRCRCKGMRLLKWQGLRRRTKFGKKKVSVVVVRRKGTVTNLAKSGIGRRVVCRR